MMKSYKFIQRAIVLSLVITLFISCGDFFGLKPREQEPEAPPDPPSLIEPEDSALFFNYDEIQFCWSHVSGAEKYELRLKSSAGSTITFQAQSTTSVHTLDTNRYNWSVRGYSANWTDYTDWSAERFLHVVIPIYQNSKLKPSR